MTRGNLPFADLLRRVAEPHQTPPPDPTQPRPATTITMSASSWPAWRQLAACKGQPIAIFFPEGKGNGDPGPARDICAGCPVRLPCMAEATANPTELGIWAGTTKRQRSELRSEAKAAGVDIEAQALAVWLSETGKVESPQRKAGERGSSSDPAPRQFRGPAVETVWEDGPRDKAHRPPAPGATA